MGQLRACLTKRATGGGGESGDGGLAAVSAVCCSLRGWSATRPVCVRDPQSACHPANWAITFSLSPVQLQPRDNALSSARPRCQSHAAWPPAHLLLSDATPPIPTLPGFAGYTTASLGVLHVPFEACPEWERMPILELAASRGLRRSTARLQPDWAMHHAVSTCRLHQYHRQNDQMIWRLNRDRHLGSLTHTSPSPISPPALPTTSTEAQLSGPTGRSRTYSNLFVIVETGCIVVHCGVHPEHQPRQHPAALHVACRMFLRPGGS